jgi:hypothetical protein
MSSSKSLRLRHSEGYPGPCRLSTALADIRATTAGAGGFSLLAVLVYVADEYPTFEAGARTLQASVVRLNGVVVIVSGWVRVGYARLCSVHSEPPSSVGRAPGCVSTCGAISLSDALIILYCFCFIYEIVLEFQET